MKNKNSSKIIFGLMALVTLMSVGYAVFGQVLNINGGGSLDYNWSVHFDNTYTEKGVTLATKPTIANENITFNVAFTKPGESKTYVFKVVNDGTIEAALKSTLLTKGATNAAGIDFKYSIGSTSEGTDLVALSTDSVPTIDKTIAKTTGVHYVTVVISYDSNTPVAPGATEAEKKATFGLSLNYLQV
ncbi:MAG: hypothetical protein RR228_03500 [Bacilli bacterium]